MPTLDTATRNAMVDAATAQVDAGSGPATIELRTGSRPAGPGSSATGTLLLTWTLNDPSYGAASSGSASLGVGSTIQATAVATGTAGYARIKDSNGNARRDLTVGTSGAELNMSTTSVVFGTVYQLTGGTLTQPAS